MNKLRRFYEMPGAERRLLAEAVVLLGAARLIVLLVPFRRIAPWLARTAQNTGPGADPTLHLGIRRAVTTAARNVPWNAVCLPQAIAAKAMLARRGYGSTLHLGVALRPEGDLQAHAWLEAGGMIVVGAAGKDTVTPLARFG